MILIIGGDSSIGASLARHLRAAGLDCVTTSRRKDAEYFLDLASPPATLPFTPTAAVLCAAVTSLAACQDHPDATTRINVEGSLAIARHLAARGCFVIGLSTNLVFDGNVPQQAADALPNPFNLYGQQKAALEKGLLGLGEQGSTLRLTKVLSPSMALFENWRTSLARSETIRPFSDMMLAPIGLNEVTAAMARLITARSSGIFQLSAAADISYAAAAARLCVAMGRDPALVQPRTSALKTPLYTSLDTGRAERELHWQTPDATALLDSYFGCEPAK